MVRWLTTLALLRGVVALRRGLLERLPQGGPWGRQGVGRLFQHPHIEASPCSTPLSTQLPASCKPSPVLSLDPAASWSPVGRGWLSQSTSPQAKDTSPGSVPLAVLSGDTGSQGPGDNQLHPVTLCRHQGQPEKRCRERQVGTALSPQTHLLLTRRRERRAVPAPGLSPPCPQGALGRGYRLHQAPTVYQVPSTGVLRKGPLMF